MSLHVSPRSARFELPERRLSDVHVPFRLVRLFLVAVNNTESCRKYKDSMKILSFLSLLFYLNVTETLTEFWGNPPMTLSKPCTFPISAIIAATILEGNISKN